MTDPEDSDFLDGCEIDFAAEADDEETQALRPLFPDGVPDPELVTAYRDLALPPADDLPTTGAPES